MILINNEQENKKNSGLTITITIIASIFMIALVVIYYLVVSNLVPSFIINYFVPAVVPVEKPFKKINNNQPAVPAPVVVPEFSTKVVRFSFPLIISQDVKDGSCLASSVAQPFRADAFICTDLIYNYDPCFVSSKGDRAICQMDPLIQDIIIINLTKPLPTITLQSPVKDNWAWFIELEDGTKLSPYTGKRPTIDGETAYYGSAINNGQRVVVIGDLNRASVWTAKVKFLNLDENNKWVTKSSQVVKIKTIWQ